jgi:hypothetical protein
MEKFEDFICKYFQEKTNLYGQYLLVASDSQDQFLSYLYSSQGATIPSVDIRNCELLTEAGLFREEIKLTRDGRNEYKLFYLTDLGKEMARQFKQGAYSDELPESPPVAPPEPEN